MLYEVITFAKHPDLPRLHTLSSPYWSKDWWPCKMSLHDKVDSLDIHITTPEKYTGIGRNNFVSHTLYEVIRKGTEAAKALAQLSAPASPLATGDRGTVPCRYHACIGQCRLDHLCGIVPGYDESSSYNFV